MWLEAEGKSENTRNKAINEIYEPTWPGLVVIDVIASYQGRGKNRLHKERKWNWTAVVGDRLVAVVTLLFLVGCPHLLPFFQRQSLLRSLVFHYPLKLWSNLVYIKIHGGFAARRMRVRALTLKTRPMTPDSLYTCIHCWIDHGKPDRLS